MTAPLIENIPAELRESPRWIVWTWAERGGKRTKVPVDPTTGRPGDATDPGLWLPFDVALAESARFSGIGFSVEDTPYTGVDLDGCLDASGALAADAEAIVRRLDSYTEVTPSGRGLRVWVRGKLPPGRRRKAGIEMYDSGRYFTVTGGRWPGTPAEIADRAAELAGLHAELFPATPHPEPSRPAPGPILGDDREVLDRMFRSRHGREIEALFEGDTGRHASGSEADLALCSHLAFWTGGDLEAIDRLFRQSALCDAKWLDRPDYRERTIARALEGTRFYDPGYGRNGTGHAGGNGQQNGHAGGHLRIAPPPREPGEDDGDPAPDAYHRTDLGNARRLVRLFGDDLRHCHPWKQWLAWAGDRWRVDETGQVYRHAKGVVAALHAEAAAAGDEAIRKATVAWALASENERRINAMVSLARHAPGVPVLPAELDRDPWLLNCPNGTLDLRTGRLGPHARGDLLTKRTSVPFDPAAACPRWEAFLDRIMGGDPELVGFLRRAAGYALTGDVSEHALFFLYGKGRNGKSTFLNTVQAALGDYAITINADLLTARNQDEHPTGVADLQGRRLVATIEVEDGRRLAESLVKTLTGGDRIRARRMRQDFYEFDPTHKLFLAANHKPTIKGDDEGIWSRIKLVPFAVTIPAGERIKNFDRLLLAEEGPGILAWAARGCLEWRAEGLRVPEAVVAATDDYRAEMDLLGDFLAERCLLAEGVRVRSGDLYKAYSEWCEANGHRPLSSHKFGRSLSDRGLAPDKVNSKAWRLGIALRDDRDDDADLPDFGSAPF